MPDNQPQPTWGEQPQGPVPTWETPETSAPETEGEAVKRIEIPGLTGAASLLRQDVATGGIGLEVPDFNLDALKFDETDDGKEGASFTESLKNTWNNSMNQLSLTDDRFFWLSEYLFGDTDSANFQEAEEQIADTEATSGETIGFTDVDDIYAEEGAIGALGGIAAATVNAAASFGTSAVQSVTTGGAALAVDMVQASIRDFNVGKAEAEGVTLEELIENGDAETFVPATLGAVAYRFEKFGIKGVGKAINGMSTGARKTLVSILNASGKEGGTEFAQSIVESFNTGLGKSGNDLDVAGDEVVKFIQEEGLETFLQGAVGGGVSAGGGARIKRAATTLRSKAAEKAIMEKSDEILTIDQLLNNPKVPKEQKDLLQKTRTALKRDIDNAISEPDGLIRKLNDEQISKINEIAENTEKLKDEAKEADKMPPVASKIVKDEINKKLVKNAEKTDKIVQKQSTTNIRNADGSIDATTKASPQGLDIINKTRKIYEKEGKTGVNKALELNEPIIQKVANKLWNPALAAKEQAYKKEDLVADVRKAYAELYRRYDPDKNKGVPIDAYINKYLPKLPLRAFDKGINQGKDTEGLGTFTTEIEGKTEQDDDPWSGVDAAIDRDLNKKTLGLAHKLGLSAATKDAIVASTKSILTGPRLASSGTQDFSKDFRDNLRTDTKNALLKEFGTGKKYKEYVTNNWRTLAQAVPRSTYSKRDDESRNWKDNNGNLIATEQEVTNYYLSPDIHRDNKSKRKQALAEIIGERVAGVAAAQLLEQEGPTSKRFKEVQELVAEKGGIDKTIDFIDRAIAQLNKYTTQDSLNVGGIQAPVHILIGGLRATKAALKSGVAVAQAIEDGYKYVADKVEGFTSEAWNNYFADTLNQFSINKAALQQGLEAGDLESETVNKLWNKLAGGKVNRLSIFTRQPKGSTSAEFAEILAKKHADNRAFFEKNIDLYTAAFPKGFWNMLGNYSKNGEFQANASALDEATIKEFAAKSKDDGLNWSTNDAIAIIKTKRTPEAVHKLATSKKYLDEVKNNQDVMFAFGDALQSLAKKGLAKTEIAGLTRSFLNPDRANANIFRRGAKLTGYSGNLEQALKRVPEHNPPAGYIAMLTFEYASKGRFNGQVKDAIRDKFGYWQIDNDYDPKGAFIAAATKDFNILTDNPNVRYFAAPEIDITQMFYLDGKSVAEKEGIPADIIKAGESDLNLAEAIKQAVVSKASSQATQAEVNEFLNKAIESVDGAFRKPVASVGTSITGITGSDKVTSTQKGKAIIGVASESYDDDIWLSRWENDDETSKSFSWGFEQGDNVDSEILNAKDNAILDAISEYSPKLFKKYIDDSKDYARAEKEGRAKFLKENPDATAQETKDEWYSWYFLENEMDINGKTYDEWQQFIGDELARDITKYIDGKPSNITEYIDKNIDTNVETFKVVEGKRTFVDKLRKVWPEVEIISDKDEAIKRLLEQKTFLGELRYKNHEDAVKYLNSVAGYAAWENYIYISPDYSVNSFNNTAIHEMGHIWSRALWKNNPELWKKGVKALIESPLWEKQAARLTRNYKIVDKEVYNAPKEFLLKELELINELSIGRRDAFYRMFDEALAGAIGDRGEELGKLSEKDISKWNDFLEGFVNWIKNTFGLQSDPRTANEFLDLGISEILQGSAADTHLAKHIKGRNAQKWPYLNNISSYTEKENERREKFVSILRGSAIKNELKSYGIWEDSWEQDSDLKLEGRLAMYRHGLFDNLANLDVKSVKENKLHAFDFDDTLFSTESSTIVQRPDGSTYELNAEEFAKHTPIEGESFDFSNFDKVIKPKALESLKLLKDAVKDGGDIVILTARTMSAKGPVIKLLREYVGDVADQIKFRGVAHGSPQAKVNYLVNAINKYGYNNVFFTDDAVKNVEAVKEALGKIKDVNSRVQLAKAVGIKKPLSSEFNQLPLASVAEKQTTISDQLQDIIGAEGYKTPTAQTAAEEGAKIDQFTILGRKFSKLRFFIPPSAEDFEGLIYKLLPKGKKGDEAAKWFDDNIFKKFAEANAAITANKIRTMNRVGKLKKAYSKGVDGLNKGFLEANVPGIKLTTQDAIRAYLFSDGGKNQIEGLSKEKLKYVTKYIDSNAQLKAFALTLGKRVGSGDTAFGYPSTNEWHPGTIDTDVVNYTERGYRDKALAQWTENIDEIFSPENLNKLQAIHGTKWRKAVEDSIKRMKSGRNRTPSGSPETDRFMDFINGSVGATMFFNFRSGVTQLISTVNFIGLPGNNLLKASKAFANQPQYWSDVAELLNSDYLVDRRGGNKFAIETSEINDLARSKNTYARFTAKLLQKGFTPTRIADSMAIALGGASWFRNKMADKPADISEVQWKKQLMIEFQEIAERNQQSSRPDRISSIQSSPLGRVIFAFANTPLQYARITKKGFQDIANGRGSLQNNLARIGWYGGLQGIVFGAIQNALFAGVIGGEDDEDEKKQNKANTEWAIKSYIGSFLKGWGLPGAFAGMGVSFYSELEKDHPTGKGLALAATSISPPISTKLRQIMRSYDTLKGTKLRDLDNALDRDNKILEGVGRGAAVFNLPLDRVIYISNSLRDAFNKDVNVAQKIALVGGWNAYQLGLNDVVGADKSNDPFSQFDDVFDQFDDAFDNTDAFDTPFDRQETGQAFKDGTIQVDPNLSPIEREKTIAHEQEHVRQMQEDGLDYDDNFVYYKGGQHRRKNGKIRYNGKWMPEGDKKFPWEAHAYEAESPIARVDDKDKKKEDEKYIRNPEHIEQVNKSRDRFQEHYSDPVTEELYRQNTGFSDLPGKVDTALNTRIQTGFVPQGAKATYDPAIGDYKGAITVEDYRDPAVVDHELTHAAGFDEALGKEAQKILGKPKSGDKYLSKPSEVYGNLHEFRTRLDLKGFERNLSPKKVQDLIKFNELEDDPDIKQMIDEFGLDKLSEALNKIASNKDKPTLEGLYG